MKQTDARQALQLPSRTAFTIDERQRQVDRICSTFVSPGAANRGIYRILLERLLPEGAGIPGPVVTGDELRQAVDAHKPGYKDVFRRLRELQGEEGVTGIIKSGRKYQLVSLALEEKRIPRQVIPVKQRQVIAESQGWRCAICSTPIVAEGAGRFDPDHKIPRTRGGSNEITNLQGLCPACNNTKSAQCSNCTLACSTCSWAYPERYRPPKIRQDLILRLNQMARERNQDVDLLANSILEKGVST